MNSKKCKKLRKLVRKLYTANPVVEYKTLRPLKIKDKIMWLGQKILTDTCQRSIYQRMKPNASTILSAIPA